MSDLASYLHRGDMPPFGFFPFGLLGMFGNLLLVAGVVLLAIWAFRAITRPMRPAAATVGAAEAPPDILARRFAAGEISAEDYQKGRDTLRGTPPPPPPPTP